MTNSRTQKLHDSGVSIWLDDLSRTRITSGSLEKLISDRNVSGVTTNPTIFANAIAKDTSYSADIKLAATNGLDAEETIIELTTADVSAACDIFLSTYKASNGVDGRVSIEVSPDLAHDTAGTIQQAVELSQKVNRENLLVKIPATLAGLPAITAVIAQGISVNVTLIFSLERYEAVIDAYLAGLEQALAANLDISKIHSVASFFVSRVDTEVDSQLRALGNSEANALLGKAAVANAALAFKLYEDKFAEERASKLVAAGANLQRPLWASTGVKDPALPDTFYVTELVASGVVNTMPEATLEAVADHGEVTVDQISTVLESAQEVIASIEALGISIEEVTHKLETEGVSKFIDSWQDLKNTVNTALTEA